MFDRSWIAGVINDIAFAEETKRPLISEFLGRLLYELIEKALEGLSWSLHLTLLDFLTFSTG